MATGITAALDAADISLQGRPLIREVSMSLVPGTLTVISGPGGSGKSSLLRVFWGALRLHRGTVICDNQDLTRASPRRWAAWRRRIGICGEDFPLDDSWTVFANVAAALYATGKIPAQTIRQRTNRELRRWDLLTRRHFPVAALSSAERTRVSLARAFIRRPPAAFLDDPFGAGFQEPEKNLWEKVRQQARAGTAVCLATTREFKPAATDRVYGIEGERLRMTTGTTPVPATG
jgi:cell division transport system ATP-binding protein